jgi:hypothetical protein
MVSINETDMGGFNKKWTDLKIESIEFETPDYQSVIITCRYDLDISNMKWKTIKNPA